MFAPVASSGTEQKPNLKYRTPTPQGDFMRAKLSPNAAEGKDRLGLKDLAALVAEKTGNNVTENKTIAEKQTVAENRPAAGKPAIKETSAPVKSKKKGNRKQKNSDRHDSPVNSSDKITRPVVSPVNPAKQAADSASDKVLSPTPVTTPVIKPQIMHQEKSTVEVKTSNKPLDLSEPIKDPGDYAKKDNSVDGFLSIKH